MLTHLQIRNFKGWRDTGRLRLAPITVFFGTNSSGKSSIGQFLMMLKQTAETHDRSRVLHPGDAHSPVDLGTFEDLVHQHDPGHELSFSLGFQEAENVVINDALHGETSTSRRIGFDCRIGFEKHRSLQAVCREFVYRLGDGGSPDDLAIGMRQLDGKNYELISDGFREKRNEGAAGPLPPPTRFFGFPDELNACYQNTGGFENLALRLQKMLRNISYLGPLRESPKRFYAWTGENPESVGPTGDRWVSALLSASERCISRGYKTRRAPFEEVIGQWLRHLGLIHSFTVRQLAKGMREYRVGVRVDPGTPEVSIPDVGFGVSQLLPVLVQAFYAPANSTVIVEQPELHLHPATQQNLADMFVGASQARENGADRNVQFLIESHSEHFLRRLQRRIAEGAVDPGRVAIYFSAREESVSRIEPLELNEFGGIKNWPKDFFGDQMTDIAEMQKAGIKRRGEGSKI